MPKNTQPCEAKARIDAEANHALGDVDKLLNTHQDVQDLQLGLEEIKKHLQTIAMDPHKAK
jgi:hypothetical protein